MTLKTDLVISGLKECTYNQHISDPKTYSDNAIIKSCTQVARYHLTIFLSDNNELQFLCEEHYEKYQRLIEGHPFLSTSGTLSGFLVQRS